MAQLIERDCVIAYAFKKGNKLMAEQLLFRISQPTAVTTTFTFRSRQVQMISLLHLAAYWGWEDVIAELVWRGCSIECKDGSKYIPLHYAAYNGHLEVTKYFAKNCTVSARNTYGETPLHLACLNGQLDITQYLINEAQCSPSCRTNSGDTTTSPCLSKWPPQDYTVPN